MIYEIAISTSDLLSECIAQSSLDFSALRVSNPAAADASYEDYTLSSDQRPEFLSRLEVVFAAVCRGTESFLLKSGLDSTKLFFVFRSYNDGDKCDVMRAYVNEYLKSEMLAWWYIGRNEKLQNLYANSALNVFHNIVSLLAPRYMSRRLRYF